VGKIKMVKKKNQLRKKNEYYLRKSLIAPTVLSVLRKTKGILHGGRALNIHMPPHLDRHTTDFDMYAKKAKERAREIEKALDKKFGGDYFRVEEGTHKGTFKVKSNVTGNVIADVTTPKGRIIHKTTLDGINYAKLSYIKRKLQGILRDKTKEFRHAKDRETLQRIKIYERLYKQSEW